jgi:hypothetical protein
MPLDKKRKSCHYKLWYKFIWQTFNMDFVLYNSAYFLYKMIRGEMAKNFNAEFAELNSQRTQRFLCVLCVTLCELCVKILKTPQGV